MRISMMQVDVVLFRNPLLRHRVLPEPLVEADHADNGHYDGAEHHGEGDDVEYDQQVVALVVQGRQLVAKVGHPSKIGYLCFRTFKVSPDSRRNDWTSVDV